MTINFPTSPNVGDTVTGPNGAVWRWDGEKWVPGGSAGFLSLSGGTLTGPLSLSGHEITDAIIDDGEYD